MDMLKASDSTLLIIDIQEKLSPHIYQSELVTHNARRLMQASLKLDIPVLVTEHYSAGLGHTVAHLQDLLPQCDVFEKIHFSAAGDEKFLEHLQASGRKDVIVLGSEAHVCVMQTALGLARLGYTLWVVDDATSSRTRTDRSTALKRLNAAGIQSLTTEMLLFEWLERGDCPAFKDILQLIKDQRVQWPEH